MDYISDGEKKEAVIAKPPQPPNVPKNRMCALEQAREVTLKRVAKRGKQLTTQESS